MTTLQYVSDALKILGVISETETPSAEQGADAVVALNDMMMFYLELGYDIGYNPQTGTSDSFTPPAGEREAIKYLLAARLVNQYPSNPMPSTAGIIASEADARWRRKALLGQIVSIAPAVPLGEGYGSTYDITTGR
jgi:hypothetical protein